MNKKGIMNWGLLSWFFVLMVLFVLGIIFIEPKMSLEERCEQICEINEDIYYDSEYGAFAPDVCLCKETGGKIYSLNIG